MDNNIIPIYRCDPDKNTKCPKTNCGHMYQDGFGCFNTFDREFALTDEKGQELIVDWARRDTDGKIMPI